MERATNLGQWPKYDAMLERDNNTDGYTVARQPGRAATSFDPNADLP